MSRNHTELTYQRAAVQSATSVGLVIILFDMLVSDLKRAMAAMDKNDVEGRSEELKHGFLVLDQMQGSLDMENGGETATSLSRFYAVVRSAMMEAHIKVNADLLRRQVELLFEVREAWAQVNGRPAAALDSSMDLRPSTNFQEPAEDDRLVAASWSA